MTVRDSSLVTLKEPQDYDPAPGAKRGSETGTRLVPQLGWPALRTNGLLQPQLARRPLNHHSSSPKGRPRSMLTRTRLNSFALSGAFTRPVQSTKALPVFRAAVLEDSS